MPGAKGALVRLLTQRELVYRTAPAAAAKVIPHTSWGVERDARRQQNPTLNGSRLPTKSDQGDPIAGGPFSSILDLRTVGNWLMYAFGVPTVRKAVATQPVNVTGVTVHHANAVCPSGNGTLTYVQAGQTLAWTANGGVIGAAVAVGAGGNFTLAGGAANQDIRVTVNAAALPVANQADATINVHATLKAHSFPVNTSDLPSALFEAQHSDIAKYYRVLGAKVGDIGSDIMANEQNVSGTLVAAVETEEVAAFDANPTSFAHVRACSARAKISDNAAGLGDVIGGNWRLNNNLQPEPLADGLDGYGLCDEGEIVLGGTIRTMWNAGGAYSLARLGNSSRFRFEQAAPVGADTYKLVMDFYNAVELTEKQPPKEGRSGLRVELAWRAHFQANAPEIYLINDVAAY